MSVPTKTVLDAYALIREITAVDANGPRIRMRYTADLAPHLREVIRKAHASVKP